MTAYKESLFDRLWREWVIVPAVRRIERKCAKARDYLIRHDLAYRSAHAGIEIVNRRNRMYANGIRPDDPRIPDRWSIEKEMPPLAWPHRQRGQQ